MSNFIKKPFLPHELPPQNIKWEFLIPMIGEAHAGIARFDGLLSSLINPNVLLAPLTTKEAVMSSRIEGTQASVEDVFEFEAGLFEEKSDRKRCYMIALSIVYTKHFVLSKIIYT